MKKMIAVLACLVLLAACDAGQEEDRAIRDLSEYSVIELRHLLEEGKVTSVELVTRLLEKAEEHRGLNATIYLDAELALKLAAAADTTRAAGETDQTLLGIPIVVKDNIHVAGMPNTAGTPALMKFTPSESNAVVRTMQAAGAIVMAKTNLHELAFGITSNNKAFGAVGNPHNPVMFAGGSSGGTAAAVSAGIAPAGLGTDTGGSVRIPAALTGVVGFRPSSGRYESTAVTPISATRDTVGLIATNVADVIFLDEVVVGRESVIDSTEVSKLRLGVPRTFLYENIDKEVLPVVEDALRRLRDAGVTLIEADIDNIKDLVAQTSFPIALHEVVRQLPTYLDDYQTGVSYEELVADIASPDVQGVFGTLAGGGPIDDEGYAAAMAARKSMQGTFEKYFDEKAVDAIVFPMTLLPARPITGSDETVELNGENVPTFPTYIHNTDHATIAGLPSISIPAGLTASGLPIGIALEGPAGSDERLLAIAFAVEQVLDTGMP